MSAMTPLLKRANASNFVLVKDESSETEVCFKNNEMAIYINMGGDFMIDRVYIVDELGKYSIPVKKMNNEQLVELLDAVYLQIEDDIQNYESFETTDFITLHTPQYDLS